jgi:hypothetical protein
MNLNQLVQAWLHTTYSPVKYMSSTNPTTSRANFLGYDNSDSGANGENIYNDPENLPTAIASILNHVQKVADFHPASQSPQEIGQSFSTYLRVLDTSPFFDAHPVRVHEKHFDNGNYNQLFSEIAKCYHGLTEDTYQEMRKSISNMARSVFDSSGSSQAWVNLFAQSTIDYLDNEYPKLFLYYSTFHMKKDTSGKSDVLSQEFKVVENIFSINTSIIQAAAAELAEIDKKSVDDWLENSTSQENSNYQKCFTL